MTTLPATNRALLALILASTLHAAALAAPTQTRFEPSVQVAGTKLQLNGTGTRFKAIFKVYDMALYTPRKVRTREELMALSGAMRMQFTALRELSTTDLGLLFLRGMAENTLARADREARAVGLAAERGAVRPLEAEPRRHVHARFHPRQGHAVLHPGPAAGHAGG